MITYRKPPENIIIDTKVVNGHVIYLWAGKPYHTEYLARKAAQRALKIIEQSIHKKINEGK